MSDEIDFSLVLYTIMSPGLDPYLHEFINKHLYKHTKRGNDASSDHYVLTKEAKHIVMKIRIRKIMSNSVKETKQAKNLGSTLLSQIINILFILL